MRRRPDRAHHILISLSSFFIQLFIDLSINYLFVPHALANVQIVFITLLFPSFLFYLFICLFVRHAPAHVQIAFIILPFPSFPFYLFIYFFISLFLDFFLSFLIYQ